MIRGAPAEQLTSREVDRGLRERTNTETWLAEVLNGSMYNNFEFTSDGEQLFGEDGASLREQFDNGISTARAMVQKNPSLLFELRRRLVEREELNDMESMSQGELYTDDGEQANVMVVVSDFPPELMAEGKDKVGYNRQRKQTMLRVIALNEDGAVNVSSQSLDLTNRKALEAVYGSLNKKPEEGELLGQRIYLNLPPKWRHNLSNNLRDTYDRSLAGQFGGEWHAGIRKTEERKAVNTYEFACAQTDLVDWFTEQKLNDSRGAEKLRYTVAATASARYEAHVRQQVRAEQAVSKGEATEASVVAIHSTVRYASLEQEMYTEGRMAAIRGKSFSGCGDTLDAEGGGSTDGSSTEGQLELSGYGGSGEEYDRYGSLKFHCKFGHENERPRNKLIDKCRTCKTSVKC